MKTKYDEEIEKHEKGTARVDTLLKELKQKRDKITKPYDEKINKVRMALHEGRQELSTLKHKREIWIRNRELQKNKDLFSKGMSFKDLLLTGNGKFSDYQYFLKSGTDVIPRLHLFVEGVNSEDEFRAKVKEILATDITEYEDASRAFLGRPDFILDVPIKMVRTLYQAGFKFKAYPLDSTLVQFRETAETMMRRREKSRRTSNYPLSYDGDPETVTVIRKEAVNES